MAYAALGMCRKAVGFSTLYTPKVREGQGQVLNHVLLHYCRCFGKGFRKYTKCRAKKSRSQVGRLSPHSKVRLALILEQVAMLWVAWAPVCEK